MQMAAGIMAVFIVENVEVTEYGTAVIRAIMKVILPGMHTMAMAC